MIDKYTILHLTLINDIGPAIIQKVIQLQRSDRKLSDLYSLSQVDWTHFFGLSSSTAQKIVDGLSNKDLLNREVDAIEKHGIKWATVEQAEYPSLLREIYLPPAVIYWQGNLINNNQRKLAIVGARKADAYGQAVIALLIPDFVSADYTIVSGGAQGIDTMAHQATLQFGGKTIVVLGSGLLRPYPLGNKKLFSSIVDKAGAVISCFPLMAEPLPGNFPARNRIITGLSHGCLVVQAAQKSGALISAHYAMEQGREVFAVPGSITSALSAGCNTLIQNGAKLVMNSADVFNEFGGDAVVQPARQTMINFDNDVIQSVEAKPKNNYSAQQKIIIAACKDPISFDDIIIKTQLMPDLIQLELFNLQLDEVISQDFTGMWKIV